MKALAVGLCGAALGASVSTVAGAVSVPSAASAVAVPALTTPGVSVAGVSVAGVSVPSVSVPVLSVPSTSVPSVSVPSTSVPAIPSTSTPAVVGQLPIHNSPAPAPAGTRPVTGGAAINSGGPLAARSSAPAARVAPGGATRSARGGVATAHAPPSARHRGALPTPSTVPSPSTTPRAATTSGTGGARSSSKKGRDAAGNPLDAIGGQIPLPLPVPDWSKPIILALLLIAIGFGVRSRLASRRARGLESQRATLLHDLDVMQAAVVPEVPVEFDGLSMSVAHRAAEGPGGGGDFYDVFSPEPGKVAVVLGDVVGHGHEALTDAALMRYTLRAYLLAGLEPRATLALAGQVLTNPGSERYVTVAIGVFDARSGDLTYATAGHPTPIILGSYEPASIFPCPAISSSLKTGRRQTKVSLQAGARVCFFSDGLTEARVEDGLLGRDRLCEILTQLGPHALAGDLLRAIRTEAESCPDDMSACIVLPETGLVETFSQVEELEADGEALAAGRAERFLEECVVPGHMIAGALDRAGAIAGQHATALIRVEIQSAGATVTVSRPRTTTVGSPIIRTPRFDADRVGPAPAGH